MKNKITSLLLATLLIVMAPNLCQASTGVLVDCEKSPGFTKRLNASVKKLEIRLKNMSLEHLQPLHYKVKLIKLKDALIVMGNPIYFVGLMVYLT
jgi:predicted metalloprotease